MAAGPRDYLYQCKYEERPLFSFRCEIDQVPLRFRNVDQRFESPAFEVSEGVQIFLRMDKRMMPDGKEWLSAQLGIRESSPVKVAKLSYTLALLRPPPHRDLRLKETEQRHFNAHSKNSWGWDKVIRFEDLLDPNQGYLTKDGHVLTVLVEGSVHDGERRDEREIVLIPETCALEELEAAICKKMLTNLRRTIDEGLHTDFVVKAKDTNGVWKELKVHKCVLSAGSVVFEAMLSQPDLKECRKGQVEIEDIAFEGMEALIRFLYTGKVAPEACKGQELELLVAADKYQIDGLKRLVEYRLAGSLSVETVCDLLVHAERLKAALLWTRCAKFIRERRWRVVESEGWHRLCAPEHSSLMGALFSGEHRNPGAEVIPWDDFCVIRGGKGGKMVGETENESNRGENSMKNRLFSVFRRRQRQFSFNFLQ